MTQFNFLEEENDVVYVAAAIGRVSNENLIGLLQRLVNTMTPAEHLRYIEVYQYLEFSTKRQAYMNKSHQTRSGGT